MDGTMEELQLLDEEQQGCVVDEEQQGCGDKINGGEIDIIKNNNSGSFRFFPFRKLPINTVQ